MRLTYAQSKTEREKKKKANDKQAGEMPGCAACQALTHIVETIFDT